MRKKTILLIDNDTNYRDKLQTGLQNIGYAVLTAGTGLEGLLTARASLPDLILCEIPLGELDGYAVLSEILRSPEMGIAPFFFLTQKVSIPEIRKAMESGADDILSKAMLPSDIIRSMEARFKRFERFRESLQNSPIHEMLSPEDELQETAKAPLDKDANLLLMVGNKPENIKIRSIVYITASAEYSTVYCVDGKKYFVRKLLKNWEQILPNDAFIRVHRSSIIHLEYAVKFEKWFNNSFRVFLWNIKEPLLISRRYSSKLRARLHH